MKKITILGRMNDVNVQVEMEIDYPAGVSGIDITKEITEYWHTAGLQPPVPGKTTERTYSEKVTGATGRHPDDLTPMLHGDGKPYNCHYCGKPLYVTRGISKKTDREWQKWKCPKSVGGCGANGWGYEFDRKLDDNAK